MKDLLIALYALLTLFHAETPMKEPIQALKNPSLKKLFPLVPGLEDAIKAAYRGEFDFAELGMGLHQFYKIYSKDPTSRVTVKNLLAAFGRWMRSGSEGALKVLELNSASTVFPPWASTAFVKQVKDQSPVQQKLKNLLKKMTGTPGLGFTSTDDAKSAAANTPALYKEFLATRAEFNKIWKAFLANLVRTSGEKTIPYQTALKKMKAAGIEHMLPLGFMGGIDAAGRWYSQFGELMNINPNAALYPHVVMNPNYTEGSGVWICKAIYANGHNGQKGYTVLSKQEGTQNKFEAVRNFAPIVDKVRKNWITLVKQFDENHPSTVAALILELLFQFSARIGHFSAIHRSGYSPILNGFQVKYLGKKNVPTKHKYTGSDPFAKHVVKCVASLAEGKKPKEFLFTYRLKNGNRVRVTQGVVNALFHKLGAPADVTVHKLRTYNGTKLFRAELEKVYAKRKNLTPKEGMEILRAMAMKVGKLLNHVRTTADGSTVATAATALSAYIDVSVQVEFFQHYGLPLPKYLEDFDGGKDSGDDLSASMLVVEADFIEAEGYRNKSPTNKKPSVQKPVSVSKPTKPYKPPQISMQDVPDPIVPEGSSEADEAKYTREAKEGKDGGDDPESVGNDQDMMDQARIPNAPGKPEEVTPEKDREEIEKEEAEDLEEDKIREALGEDAQSIVDHIFYGGSLTDAYEVTPGKVENLLISNPRFNKGRP